MAQVDLVDSNTVKWAAAVGELEGSAGDVVGPASAVADRIAVFDGTTGKLVKDGGATVASVVAAADGLVVVKHGATAATARPTAGTVYWQGSVDPTNRALGDFWLDTPAYD